MSGANARRRENARRGGWAPLGAMLVTACLVLGLLAAAPTPRAGQLVLGGHGDHVALSDFPGNMAPYSPAELYGGGSPVETCYTCQSNAVDGGGSPAASIDPNADVDPANGDFSTTNSLIDVGAVGSPLALSLSYDAQLAQADSTAYQANCALYHEDCYAGAYGWGWSTNLNMSLSYSSGTATVYEENGAQVVFSPVSSGDGCPLGDYQSFQKYTVPSSAYGFCAPERVDAQLGYFPAYSDYKFEESGGATIDTFNYYGQLVNIGTNNTDSYSTNLDTLIIPDATPGSVPSWDNHSGNACPSNGGDVSCTIEIDSTGRDVIQEVGSVGLVNTVLDPDGATYSFSYNSNATLSEIATPDGNWEYSDNIGNAAPYNYQVGQITDPNNHTTTIGYYTSGSNIGLVDGEMDPAQADTTYTYADSCGACVGTGQEQVTTINYPETASPEVDVDHYYQGMLTSSAFGSSSTSSADYQTWTYNYSFPTSTNQDGPTTETVVHPNAANSVSTSVMTTDAVGNVITAEDVNGNTATSMYNDVGGNNLSELCWTAAAGSTIPANASCTNPPPRGAGYPDNVVTSYTYDSFGHVTSMTDPLGNVTRYGYYTATGLLCWTAPPTVTASGSPCTSVATSATSPATPGTNAPVGSTALSYDWYGNTVASTTDYGDTASGAPVLTTTSAYTSMDQESWTIPPLGQGGVQSGSNPYATNYTYYPNGHNTYLLETKTAPEGQSDTYTYDYDGKVLSDTNAAGEETFTGYDADERPCWSITQQSGSAPSGSCTSPPAGSSATTSFVASTTAPLTTVDPNGNTTTYTYSDPAYPTKPTKIQDPMNAEVTYNDYDAYGNLCLSGPVQSPNLGNSAQCNWVSGDTAYVYNAAGSELSSEDPLGNTTTYQYGWAADDTLMTKSTNALNQSTTYAYDNDGNLQQTDEPGGQIVSYGYDADSRKCWQAPFLSTDGCASVAPIGTGVSTYAYDAANEQTQMVDNNGTAAQATTTSAYTSGTLTSTTDSNNKTVSYKYGDAGEVTCIAYPVISGSTCSSAPSGTNTVVDRFYDTAMRLTGTEDWLGKTTSYQYLDYADPSAVTNIGYPASGTVAVALNSYDAAGNLKSLTYWTSANGDKYDRWTYNNDEQVSTYSLNSTTTSAAVQYNSDKQITGASLPGHTTNDTYNPATNGEMLSVTPSGGTQTTYQYNAGDELCWSYVGSSSNGCGTAPTGATTYAFNANGERQSQTSGSSTTAYGWNAYGQMCWSGSTTSTTSPCTATPSGTTSYTYNGQGLRMTSTTGSTTSDYTWDTIDGGSIPLDIDDSNDAYIYGPLLFGGTAPMEQISGTNSSNFVAQYLITNPTGVRAVVSSSGSLVEQATYSAYGIQTLQSGTDVSKFGFQGSYTDSSGLIYLIDRYYDPSTDQFMSVDPDVMETGQPYAFTGDDPLNATDPLGDKRRYVPPCTNRLGGYHPYAYDGEIGQLQMEQNPSSGRVRFTLKISPRKWPLYGSPVNVGGRMWAYTPRNNRLHSSYSVHEEPPSYGFHASLAAVPKNSTVSVELLGTTPNSPNHEVWGFKVTYSCRTVLGPAP